MKSHPEGDVKVCATFCNNPTVSLRDFTKNPKCESHAGVGEKVLQST